MPVMSAGSKSGVNCTRLKFIPRVSENVVDNKVLASPGLSSNKMFPPARIPTAQRSRTGLLPITTCSTSPSTACIKSCVSCKEGSMM